MDINGTRYDALSGTAIGKSSGHQIRPRRTGGSIDGFVRNAAPRHETVRTPRDVSPMPAHIRPHKPEPPKTLMRSIVKKPAIQSPTQIKAQTRTDILARTPQSVITPKLSHGTIDPKRLKKAHQMLKSPQVSRYPKPANLDTTTKAYFSDMTPAASAPSYAPAIPNIPIAQPANVSPKDDLFNKALEAATSHQQTYTVPKSKKGRRAGIITATLSLLLLLGVAAYTNTPRISMELASYKAGFDVKVPGYSPAGYSLGNLTYGPGTITLSYDANGSSTFKITQKVSDWDSQALLTNFVSDAAKAYQTYERGGRTVYFFGNNTATWVDNGIWFTVNGNESISKNQLLDLAGSI